MYVLSDDQSVTYRISAVVIPDTAAFELEAPLTKWALKIPVLMQASLKHVFNHLAIVLPVTGSSLPIYAKKSKVFSWSFDKAWNSKILASYSCIFWIS